MGNGVYAVLVLVIWISLGISAVIIFIARRGRRSWAWFPIGMILGPMLLPIAAEMDRRGERLLSWSGDQPTAPGSQPILSAMVAIDGSVESDLALGDLRRVLGGIGTQVHLVTILDPDHAGPHEVQAAADRLHERTDWLDQESASVVCGVESGEPVQMLLEYAAVHEVDLVVVGRRGKGLSQALLGSVADQLVRRSLRPVLLGTPVSSGRRT